MACLATEEQKLDLAPLLRTLDEVAPLAEVGARLAQGGRVTLGIGDTAKPVVAAFLWRGSSRAPSAYSWWAVADIVGLAIADARVEPIWWKVALGSVLAGIVLGSVAVYLRCSRQSPKPQEPQE